MATGHEKEYDELDLGVILRELYRWKWVVLGVTLLAGVIVAAYSLTKPNVYESTAALIVREPQRAIERSAEEGAREDTAVLSVETLQTLTESTATTWVLFERLLEKKALDLEGLEKQAFFKNFQRALKTSLKRRQSRIGNSVGLLPILELTAAAKNPETAQMIANEWALLVEEKSGEIYTEGVTALGTYVGEMYAKSNDSLVLLESKLAEKKLEANLAIKKAQLKTLTEKITLLEDAILDIDIELAVDEVAIEEGKKRIIAQQVDDEWIGTIAEDALLKNEPYPFAEEELSTQALKVLDLSEQKVRQTEMLRVFRKKQRLLEKEKRFAHYQLDMERILAEKAKVEDELPAVETALAALTRELENIPEKITLNKAITDDALWELHINDPAAARKDMTPLKSEMLNPLYQSMRRTIVDLTSKAETLRGSAVQLEVSEKKVSALVEDLESEIDVITEDLDRRETALDATKIAIALLRDDFLEERKIVEEFHLKNLRRLAERDIREKLRTSLMKRAQDLEKDVSDFELSIEILVRETEKTKNVRTALASKAEEAALLEVSAKNATQTGTTVLYKAQANPIKVAPSRSKLVLVAMMAVFVACGIVVCMAMLLRESR